MTGGGAILDRLAAAARATRRTLAGALGSFLRDEVFALSAALSYYTLLSMAPLLLVVVAMTGFVFGEGTVRAELVAQIRGLVGAEGATVAETVLYSRQGREGDVGSLLLGATLTLLGATAVFAQLQAGLNRIWHVAAKPGNALWSFVQSRLLSFALVVSMGFLLMVSLVLSTLLAALRTYIGGRFAWSALVMEMLNLIVSFGLATLLIAMIFKFLPDREIRWRDTWLGALITSLLLAAGKSLIGIYLGEASIGSVFGAAGSVVVFLVWVYYAAVIFYFGAEITKTMARERHAVEAPSEHAEAA